MPRGNQAKTRTTKRKKKHPQKLFTSLYECECDDEIFHVSVQCQTQPQSFVAFEAANSMLSSGVCDRTCSSVYTEIYRTCSAVYTELVVFLDDAVERWLQSENALYYRIAAMNTAMAEMQAYIYRDAQTMAQFFERCAYHESTEKQSALENMYLSAEIYQRDITIGALEQQNAQLLAQVSRLNALVYTGDIYTEIMGRISSSEESERM